MAARCIIWGLLALLWSVSAAASNHLKFGAAPQWIKPVSLPAVGTTTQAAVKLLLLDRQIKLTPRTVATYDAYAVRIQTPQGLSAAGTIALVWNPDTDEVVINKVDILRGNEVIDVLDSGQKFTVARRETNLAYATLDGRLTAILEPTDLQVGDILEVAYTLKHTDPILAGTPEAEVEIPTKPPISKVYIRAVWPSTESIQWQATQALSGIRHIHTDGMSGIAVTMTDLKPIQQPKGAYTRYGIHRRVDFTGFKSWVQLAHRLAPLYRQAEKLSENSPLRKEIARIRSATKNPKRRAAMALALVENKIRYVLLAMNGGGIVPASVDLTWSRRFGDCKAKTVLLLALLHGLDIEAEPVAVNVRNGSGLNNRLPMISLFNHVLVRATIDGKTYWLDGTRMGDGRIDNLFEPFYFWGLPLVSHGAQLISMVPPPLTNPMTKTTLHVDATGGVAQPAPLHAQVEIRGNSGIRIKMRLNNMTQKQRDQALHKYWSQQLSKAEITSVSASYIEKTASERLTMDGTLTMDWSGGEHDLDMLDLGVCRVCRFSHNDSAFRIAS